MQLSHPTFQLDEVEIFCPYSDQFDLPSESLSLFNQLSSYCQKIFNSMKLKSGISTMFCTTLNQHHLDQMVQNVLYAQKKDIYLRCECLVGDMDLSCECFTLGEGKLSFNLTDYVVVVYSIGHYSIFLVDISRLYSDLCQKVRQVQLLFADSIGQLFIQEMSWIHDTESVEVCNFNE